MVNIGVKLTPDGGAHLLLSPGEMGEVRDRVELESHEDANRIAALESLVLEFDFYGRLSGIQVTGSAGSVLAPALLDAADPV